MSAALSALLALQWLALSRSVPAAVSAETFDGEVYYIGDLHTHTGASGDGRSSDLGPGVCGGTPCGAAADFAAIAQGNGLDFVAITDHSNGTPAASSDDFAVALEAALAGHDPEGGFLVIPGAELQFMLPDGTRLGHKNLLLFGDDAQIAGFDMERAQISGVEREVEDCAQIWSWAESLEAELGPLLLVPHHPGTAHPMPTDWSCHDERLGGVVEIYSQHGNSLTAVEGWDPPYEGLEASGAVEAAMDPSGLGRRLTFIASTDDHQTQPGQTCRALEGRFGGGLAIVALPEGEPFDRAAIYEALSDGRAYGTSGPLLPVSVRWLGPDGAWLGGAGASIVADGRLSGEVRMPEVHVGLVSAVDAVGPAERWAFERGEGGRWSVEIESPPEWLYVEVRFDGERWYGDDPCDDGGADREERIWLSPSWIERTDDGCGGCGGVYRGAPWWSAPWWGALLALVGRRRRSEGLSAGRRVCAGRGGG